VRTPQTHFEQIPVAVVKQIAEPLSVKEEIEKPMRESEGSTPGSTHWQGLAQQIQKETDPQKMIHLVQQLIARYDEEELRKQRVSGTSNV
jgi:hypothetical protein